MSCNSDEDSARKLENPDGQAVLPIKHSSTLGRATWTLLILGACTGFTLHLVMLVERYNSEPVNTETLMGGGTYSFPDVTLCPTNFISNHYGNRSIPGPFALPEFKQGMNQMFFGTAKFLKMLQSEDMDALKFQYPFEMFRDAKLAFNKVAYRSKQFPEPHDIVIFCKFNSEICSFKNFTVYKDEEHFSCITFTPSDRTVIRAASESGLYVVFFLYDKASLTPDEEIGHVPGMKVMLHGPGEKPNSQTPHLLAPKKYKTEGIIDTFVEEKVNRESYQCVESLPNVTYVSDYSQLGSPAENVTFFGTMDDCSIRVRQLEFVKECGCLATDLPRPADLFYESDGVCHDIHEEFMFRDIEFVPAIEYFGYYMITNSTGHKYPLQQYVRTNLHLYNRTNDKLKCYSRVLQRQLAQGVDTTSCPVLCKTKDYSVTPVKFTWPRDPFGTSMSLLHYAGEALKAVEGTNLTMDDLTFLNDKERAVLAANFHVGVLDLHPRHLSVQISREALAYPLRNFFSDVGGILGLWIGASIVTILELVELLASAAVILWKRRANRRKDRVGPLTKD